MTEVETLDRETAEELLQEYDYPGEIFTDLHYSSFIDGVDQPDLPVEDVDQLYREMSQAGITYYTGKQLYKEASQPDPSDVLVFSFPEKDYIEYRLLGRETDSTAHYWRDTENFLEIKRYQHNLEGDLEELNDNTDRFHHLKASYLERYVDRRDWDILREPEYSNITDVSVRAEVDVPNETEQASFSRFNDSGETR